MSERMAHLCRSAPTWWSPEWEAGYSALLDEIGSEALDDADDVVASGDDVGELDVPLDERLASL